MKINYDLEKKYEIFNKTFENFKTVRKIPEPYTVVSIMGMESLFNVCCDRAYIFVKDFLEFQGFSFPVTAYPQMIIKTAHECGMIDDENVWLDILETRNLLSHVYDEDEVKFALEKSKGEFIDAFEKLKSEIEDNWLDQTGISK